MNPEEVIDLYELLREIDCNSSIHVEVSDRRMKSALRNLRNYIHQNGLGPILDDTDGSLVKDITDECESIERTEKPT